MNRIPVFVWFVVPTIVIVVVGAIFATKLTEKNEPEQTNRPEAVSAQIEGVEEFEIAGREHIAEGTKSPNYNSNPPTSGSHWPAPEKKGVFDKPIPDERLVHNLEHGYIWISYKPEAPSEVVENLKKIVEEDNWKMIMAPREQNESQIAIVAWGRLLKMNDPDYEKIKEFIKAYRNRGPEKTMED